MNQFFHDPRGYVLLEHASNASLFPFLSEILEHNLRDVGSAKGSNGGNCGQEDVMGKEPCGGGKVGEDDERNEESAPEH